MLNDFKRLVVELLKSLETGDRSPLATINPNKYIQHNLRVADGLAGFRERLEYLPKGAAKVNTVRVFQDGNLSLLTRNTTSAVLWGAPGGSLRTGLPAAKCPRVATDG
jgi:predicted SnoaL-like aldol condensation-catalyzing enzyme